ncbi:MAG: hypothetical protein ACI9U2_004926 [Bradymonadia bacterium]|jgi:hypothetical protein
MLLTFIGLEATLSVARWAKARGVPIWPALRTAKPTPAGFVRAIAREAVCSDALIARSMRDNGEALPALRQRWQLRSYESLAPMQSADLTFAALRGLIKADEGGASVEASMLEVIEINRGAMLTKFEEAAGRFDGLMGE